LRIEDLRFQEIEHKFLVGEDFDAPAFRAALEVLKPLRHATLHVRDRYFVTEAGRARGFVLRHRFDRELHELTLKSIVPDAEVRDEINLKLQAGDQQAQVDAFVAAQGVLWQGALWKDLEVWHFHDCEAVFYVATADDRTVRCVEFEATVKPSREAALAIVSRYEHATGFAEATRTPESLLALLWPEAASIWRST
jgi:CYTH domain-containing protein